MTKTELEEKIRNEDSVWLATEYGIKELKKLKLKDGLLTYYNEDYKFNHTVEESYFESLYKTQAEAEHYLHHANITRTETLPFLTWEEFKQKEYFDFFNGSKGFRLYISHTHNENIRLITYGRYNPDGNVLFEIPQTEENFYKAYDECVRLFRGDEE